MAWFLSLQECIFTEIQYNIIQVASFKYFRGNVVFSTAFSFHQRLLGFFIFLLVEMPNLDIKTFKYWSNLFIFITDVGWTSQKVLKVVVPICNLSFQLTLSRSFPTCDVIYQPPALAVLGIGTCSLNLLDFIVQVFLTLETSLICILLSASRDMHFDKRMICFLSGLL